MKMTELLPFIEDALKENKTFTLPITGTSMLPLLVQGRDTVELAKIDGVLEIGDLPLYRRKDGAFVLHRVVGIEDGRYIMCGDNQFILEKGIAQNQLIGVVCAITRDGKKFSVTDPKYVKYVAKMCGNISRRYPLRRLRYKLAAAKNSMTADSEKNNNAADEQQQSVLETGGLLVKIISDVINNTCSELPQDTDFQKIYRLAEKHRVAAVAAPGVINRSDADESVKKLFKKELFRASARFTAQETEMKKVSALFSENGIEHCFLKGGRTASFYDIPESRFMLDADIYIDEKNERKAASVLLENGYTEGESDGKDRGFTKPPCINIELHRVLKYEYDAGNEYYMDAFSRLVKCSDSTSELKMTDEDFYVYILSHTAHHFGDAGTGIKSVVDHYYLRKKLLPLCDAEKVNDALNATGLALFASNMDRLCDCWFGSAEYDDSTRQMSDYIILSGVFGTGDNNYVNGVLMRGLSENTSKYFISRLFPGLKMMRERYAVLKKLPFLLPVFWIVRIMQSLFSVNRLKNEAKTAGSATKRDIDSRRAFLEDMGLK